MRLTTALLLFCGLLACDAAETPAMAPLEDDGEATTSGEASDPTPPGPQPSATTSGDDDDALASTGEDPSTTVGSTSGGEPDEGSGSSTTEGGSSSTTGASSCNVSGTWSGQGSYFDKFDGMDHTIYLTLDLEQHEVAPAEPCFFEKPGPSAVEVTGSFNGDTFEQGVYDPDTNELCIRDDNYYIVSRATLSADCDALTGNWATEGFAYDYEAERD